MRKIPIPLHVSQYFGVKNSGRIKDIRPSTGRLEATCMARTLEGSREHVCTLSHIVGPASPAAGGDDDEHIANRHLRLPDRPARCLTGG